MRKAGVAAAGCLLLVLAAGCGGSSPAAPLQVATLHVTNGSPQHPVTLNAKTARVAAGSKFSVTVDTSDGPEAWDLTTVGHPGVVEKQGSAPVGSCGSPPKAGCTVPQRYTFVAKAAGTATMVWVEYALGCSGQPGERCPAVIQPIKVTVTK